MHSFLALLLLAPVAALHVGSASLRRTEVAFSLHVWTVPPLGDFHVTDRPVCSIRAVAAPAVGHGARAPSPTMYGNLPKDSLVERGRVTMNPMRNLMQMQDQRVAGVSQILLAPGKCTLPLAEAKALMVSWKEEIGDDAEKFAEKAKAESHCPTGKDGGSLGFVVRGKCSEVFDDVIFKEEPGKVYGPVTTKAGLALLYLHSCREPGKN